MPVTNFQNFSYCGLTNSIMRGLGSDRLTPVAICGRLSGRRRWIVREACRAGSLRREPCCKIPAGAGEGISARIHAANSQGDRAKEGCRRVHRHSTNSLGERAESCVTLVASIVLAGLTQISTMTNSYSDLFFSIPPSHFSSVYVCMM